MKPNKIWANLGVDDINRTTKFYSQLGFTLKGITDEISCFIFGDNGLIVNFFLKETLKSNVKGNIADLSKGNEIIFTIGAKSREEVDAWEKEVITAGGTLISTAEEFGEGYYGFIFTDPDGHKFNVFHM